MSLFEPAPSTPPNKADMDAGALAVVGSSGSSKCHVCDVCPRAYTTAYSLREHKDASHEGKTHSCEHCGKVCKRVRDLNAHKKKAHTEENGSRFSCPNPDCDKSFSKKGNLRRHCRTQTKKNPRCITFLLDLDKVPETLSQDESKSGNSNGNGSDIGERNAIVRGDPERDVRSKDKRAQESCNELDMPVEQSILVKDNDAEVMTAEERLATQPADITPVSSLYSVGLDGTGAEAVFNEDSEMSDNRRTYIGSWTEVPAATSASTDPCPDVDLYTNASIAAKALKTREASWITLATERVADSAQKTAMAASVLPEASPQPDVERFNRLDRYFTHVDWYIHSLTCRLEENMDMSSDMTSDIAP